MIKTPVESIHIPTKENNAEALALTKDGIMKAKDISMDFDIVQKEMQLLENQVFSIMTSIEKKGQGSIARGVIKAFESGILDIPFSPSIFNKGKLVGARDCDGAIRFVNPENLPFSAQVKDFHKEKISQRMAQQRITKTHQILESDLTRIWKKRLFNLAS